MGIVGVLLGGVLLASRPQQTQATPPKPSKPTPPPAPASSLLDYNLNALNAYRAKVGSPPLTRDPDLNAFALAGSQELSSTHQPHGHFIANEQALLRTRNKIAENQSDPNGRPPMDSDSTKSAQKLIDQTLALMFAEGPGGGHYENMISIDYKRLGVGLLVAPDGKFYLTNDFSS